MSKLEEDELRKACDVLSNYPNILDDNERTFLMDCKESDSPLKFIQNNVGQEILNRILSKLEKLQDITIKEENEK
jgi:hypothetical protein